MRNKRIIHHPYRNRHRLHHTDDEFITYMNGVRYSKQWMSDVEHKRDWYDPHWMEHYKTPLNQQIYRFTGKEPWYSWKAWALMHIILPGKFQIVLLAILLSLFIPYIANAKKYPCSGGLPDWYCYEYKPPTTITNPSIIRK